MNRKVTRKQKVFNNRFRDMGFVMRVEINSNLSSDVDFTVELIHDSPYEKQIMKLVSWCNKSQCSLWFYDSSISNLNSPQPVSDFLYYAFSIIDDLRKETANENKN